MHARIKGIKPTTYRNKLQSSEMVCAEAAAAARNGALMINYLAKRLLEMIPTLFGITLISFFIIHLAPGKPTDALSEMNPKMTPEARERLEKCIISTSRSWSSTASGSSGL